MRMSDFARIVFIVTVMAVLYINLQVKIYAFAYRGKAKEQSIEKLAEVNGRVRNDILRLRSSDHVGRELLGKNNQYQFVSNKRIVEVAMDKPSISGIVVAGAEKTEDFFAQVALALAR